MDLEKALAVVSRLAREVGAMQREHLGRCDLAVQTKSSSIDLVTEVDVRSEGMILAVLRREFPQTAILSEESGPSGPEAEYCWIVDPLDGTTNYAQGLPVFAVSIALQRRGETVLGVVYAPCLDQLFTAVKGCGARLNGRPLQVARKPSLAACVLATGFPYDVATHPANNVAYFSSLVLKTRALRRFGAAAYDLACVAAGQFDGFWEMNLSPWDAAAGALLVTEAGGEVRSFREDRKISIVAGAAEVCRWILEDLCRVDAAQQHAAAAADFTNDAK